MNQIPETTYTILYIFLCTHFNDSSFQHDFLYDKLYIFKKCCKIFIISDSVEYHNFFLWYGLWLEMLWATVKGKARDVTMSCSKPNNTLLMLSS